MALLCNHIIPVNYDDNNNDLEQKNLGSWNNNSNDCLLIKDIGVTTNIYNNSNSIIANYNDVVSGIRVRPGYKLTAYTDPNRLGIYEVYRGGTDGLNKYINTSFLPLFGNIGDKISSVFLEYEVKTASGVYTSSDTVIPEIKENYKDCHVGYELKGVAGEEICHKEEVLKECELLDIDKMAITPICAKYKDNIIAYKCKIDDTLFSKESCMTYCQNLSNDDCKRSFKEYCSKIENKDNCLKFCNKTENKDACKSVIVNTCKDKEIITNILCQNTASLVDNTNYVKVMSEYCNTVEGKDKELCACYNTEKINTFFSDIKKPYLKKALTSIPECSYDLCKNTPKHIK